MKSLINSFVFVLRLFVSTLVIAFAIASTIVYFVTSVKFALFLAVCGIIPTCFILLYFYDSWQNDLL